MIIIIIMTSVGSDHVRCSKILKFNLWNSLYLYRILQIEKRHFGVESQLGPRNDFYDGAAMKTFHDHAL